MLYDGMIIILQCSGGVYKHNNINAGNLGFYCGQWL